MNIDLLSDLCRIPGAPGFESPIRNFIIDQLKPLSDDTRIDPMGNIISVLKGQGGPKLLLTAHMDEIGFIVQHIDDEGFIRVLPLGGFDPKTLTAQRVLIHGRKDVLGVMGSKPIHLMGPEERNKVPVIKDYFIDTGLSKTELDELVCVGDPVTRERDLVVMGRCVNAKSLDNRISVYTLLQVVERLKAEQHHCEIIAVFTVQEELGLRGAKTLASQLDPVFAINIDTTIAFDVPGAQPHEVVTRLGQGAGIKIMDSSVICDVRMVSFLRLLAEKQNIRWQPELLPAGGTDAGAVQTSGSGCIAGAVSIPTRHIHQVLEMVNMDDVACAIDLLTAACAQIHSYDWSH